MTPKNYTIIVISAACFVILSLSVFVHFYNASKKEVIKVAANSPINDGWIKVGTKINGENYCTIYEREGGTSYENNGIIESYRVVVYWTICSIIYGNNMSSSVSAIQLKK
jgi:predicted small secreted protein